MFDFIVNNIFVLIPIAILIGIRIVNARRRSQEAAGKNNGNVLKRTDDERTDRANRVGSVGPIGSYAPPSPAPKKKTTVKQTAPVPIIKTAEAATEPVPVKTEQQEKRDFTEKLKYLSPLQRAVAFSEILGPPKGI